MSFTVEIPPDIFSQNCLESLPESEPSQDDQQEYVPLSQLILPEVPGTHLESLEEKPATHLRATHYLLKDLAQRNWSGYAYKNGTENVNLSLKKPEGPFSKQEIREVMQPRRLELIRESAEWIKRVEPSILEYLADGDQLSPLAIKPELEECETQEQRDIFRYCRFLSAVPYTEYVGRRMKFLIRDGSLPNRPIIGITALGSSLLQITARDEWIGWHTSELRNTKKLRIAHLMDQYVAVAIPPYSWLLGGKLACYMMVSNEVREAFNNKYENQVTLGKKRIVKDLVMLVTTSVYGQNSSQYNRLKYQDRLLYIPVGETVGFGTLHLSQDTFNALREVLTVEEKELSYKFGKGANWKLRVVRDSIKFLGFDADECLNHGHSRGVYVVPLAQNAIQFLRGETDNIDYFDYPLEDLVNYWRQRWLTRRIQNKRILQKVKDFEADSLRLTLLLDEEN